MSVYRALVVSADDLGNNVYVKIPHVLGPSEVIALHTPANTEGVVFTWTPTVGAQVLVAVEGSNFDKVYLLSVI